MGTKKKSIPNIVNSSDRIFVFAVDRNYCFTSINDNYKSEMKRLWGADIKTGDSLLESINEPEGSKIAKDNIDKALNGETFSSRRELAKEGIVYDFIFNPIILNNKVTGVIVLFHDISEHENIYNRLKESERNLQESQEAAQLGSYVWDISTNLWTSSNVMDEIFGIDEKYERTMEGWNAIVHPDSRSEMTEYLINNILIKHEIFNKEYKIVRQDNGKVCWVHGIGKLEVDENNNPTKLFGTISDITERKVAEKTLEEIRILHEGFSRASFEAIFFSEKGICIEQNHMAEEMFGYTKEEALGRYGTEWLIPEDRDRVMKNMLAGYEKPYEANALRKDGTTFPCQLHGNMIKYKGREVRVTSLYDITFSKQAKEELEKINRLLKIKSRMNEVIRNSHTNNELFQEICNLVVNDGEFRFSWYGELDEISGNVNPKAFAGFEDGYLSSFSTINISNAITGTGPTGKSIREGTIIVCNEIANNPLMKSWREEAMRRGYASSIAIPIKVRNKYIGAFTIYSKEVDFFSNAEEFELIKKIADNLMFSLENIINEQDRKRAEQYQVLTNEILKTLNSSLDLNVMMGNVVKTIKEEMGFSAVGIRLNKDGDYPYFVQHGFSNDFLKTENSILSKGCNGITIIGKDGKPAFECTCGLVVSGKTVKSRPLLTEAGSFYTNNSYPLLELPADVDPRTNPRNKCIHLGYNSFAIIPIVTNEKIVGTLQLNDKNKDAFTIEMIHFFEGICLNIGTALMREQAEENLEKNMEELIIINKKLEQLAHSNKELEQFAYLASHDLKEPLRTVENYIQLFEEDYKNELDDKGLKYLNTVIGATKRMDNLIKTLLEFSRLGINRKLSMVDCKHVIEDVLADLDSAISSSGAIIDVLNMPTINLFESEIRQLFQNLITNAIKFRKKDIVPLIRIGAEKINGGWKFSVSDNGIGIPAAYHKRVFEIFQRLHTSKQYEGTGIGLAHCKKIIQLHLGEIWIESTEGAGTIFYFTIPKL